METENANNPHGEGPIDSTNFVPFPKNPIIAKFFIQLGRVEELGSGILTTTRLMKEYAGQGKASFSEEIIFKTAIPLPDTKTDSINDTLSDTINDLINDTISGPIRGRLNRLLKLVLAQSGLKISELTQKLAISESTTKCDLERIRILIEYKGSKKTGGYFPTDYLNSKLDEG